MLNLEGRSCLVTGGSRGIGRAVSVLMGRLGARVAVHYVRDSSAALATAEEVERAGGEAFVVQADLARPEDAEALVRATVDRLSGLDIAVVNHGIWKRASLDAMTLEDWEETIRVNLTGAYAVCRHGARAMMARGKGAIVTIASTAGQRGRPTTRTTRRARAPSWPSPSPWPRNWPPTASA